MNDPLCRILGKDTTIVIIQKVVDTDNKSPLRIGMLAVIVHAAKLNVVSLPIASISMHDQVGIGNLEDTMDGVYPVPLAIQLC